MSQVHIQRGTGTTHRRSFHHAGASFALLSCGPQRAINTPIRTGMRNRRHHWRSLARRRNGLSESSFFMVLLQTRDSRLMSYTAS